MTLKEIIELLHAGAQGCRSAASESWEPHASRMEEDADCLDELASQLKGKTHLWVEGAGELMDRITR